MNTNKHVITIDILRFFAAFIVALFHLCYWASFKTSTPGQIFRQAADYTVLNPISAYGWVGVEIFFVISGFVIANSSVGKSPLVFLKNRALRLYPAVWICSTIALIVLLLNGKAFDFNIIAKYLHSMVLIPNYDKWVGWIDSVQWTLMYEI